MRSLRALLPAALVLVFRLGHLPEAICALAAVPAVLYAPGAGFARRLSRDPLRRALDAFWISALLAVPGVLLGAWTGLGAPVSLAFASLAAALGARLPSPPALRLPPTVRLACRVALAATAVSACVWIGTLFRPLDAFWYASIGERAGWHGDAPAATVGFGETRYGGALRLDPEARQLGLLGPMQGTVLLLLRAPVGATMTAGRAVTVVADPVEQAAGGPVARYLDEGVATLVLSRRLEGGERLPIELSDPTRSVLYVIPDPEALADLDHAGVLRFVHYERIGEMLAQVRWARELYGARRHTTAQPPLWSYVSAGPLALTGGDLPTQNVVFMGLSCLTAFAGVAFVRAFAPGAPWLAWLLPAAALVEHARLLLSRGTAGMPDTLHVLAVVSALTALAGAGPRFPVSALLAQLTRYPGAALAMLGAILDGQVRRAARLGVAALGVALIFGTGAFPELRSANPANIPDFFRNALLCTGAIPLLAALRWPRGTRVALGTALIYSAFVAPFAPVRSLSYLPLLHLGAVALACTANDFEAPALRHGLPILGLLGLLAAQFWIPVIG